MPEQGHSWQRDFKALPEEGRAVRQWAAARVPHTDAPQVAHEMFVAVLGSHPDRVTVTLSTSGARVRITAAGPVELPVLHAYGPGRRIVSALSALSGSTTDGRGLWAQLKEGP